MPKPKPARAAGKDLRARRCRCKLCGRTLRGVVPKGGDGTLIKPMRHKRLDGAQCEGHVHEGEEVDEVDAGANGHARKHKPVLTAAERKEVSRRSRAAIMPSQSVSHCTSPVVAEGIIYPVLGDPVDLDPCSNPESIIRARRVVMLPEDGLSIPWRGKVFVNPPYGDGIELWIRKIIAEYRHNGAEVIALIPASVSAEWFDLVAATARAAFLWGPGEGGRRIVFMGNENAATFASCVAYWGPNLPLFVQHAIRFCHPWYPEYDLRLTRAILADREASGQAMGSVALADDLLALSRHDDLAAALVSLGEATLGDVIDWGRSALLHRLRSLSTYELASALVCSTRPGVHWLERRLPRTPPPSQPNQLGFAALQPAKQPEESLDEAVYRHVLAAGPRGVAATELEERLAANRGAVRGALDRLREAERVTKTGTTRKAAYIAVGEEGHDPRHPS